MLHYFEMSKNCVEKRKIWCLKAIDGNKLILCSDDSNDDEFDNIPEDELEDTPEDEFDNIPIKTCLRKDTIPYISEKSSTSLTIRKRNVASPKVTERLDNLPVKKDFESHEVSQPVHLNSEQVCTSGSPTASTNSSSNLTGSALTSENVALKRKINSCIEENLQYQKQIQRMVYTIKSQEKQIKNFFSEMTDLQDSLLRD